MAELKFLGFAGSLRRASYNRGLIRAAADVAVESASPIPDDRLEAEPLAERTVAEQSEYERSQR